MGLIKPDRHELFAQAMVKGMPQEQAYVEAGYKYSPAAASRVSKNVNVINRMAELRARQVNKGVILSKHYVLEATIENAEKALGRKPVKVTRRVRQGDEWVSETDEVYLYKGDVANAALKMLGNEIGLFVDKKELRVVNEFDKMSDEELAAELARAAQLLLEAPGPVIEHEDGENDPD